MLAPVLEARPLASEVRLILLRPLPIPGGKAGGGIGLGEKYGSEEPLCEEGIVAIVPVLEKLRIAWRAGGGRGAVLVLLRLRLWFEKRGTWGGSAARSSSAVGTSGTGSGALPKDRLPFGMGLGRPFATRIESRIGLRRRLAVAGVGEPGISPVGAGGTAARSWRPIEEWLRKDRAVSQT